MSAENVDAQDVAGAADAPVTAAATTASAEASAGDIAAAANAANAANAAAAPSSAAAASSADHSDGGGGGGDDDEAAGGDAAVRAEAARAPPPPLAEQAALVRDLDTGEHKVELRAGDRWFLIDAKWFQAWQEYVAYEDDSESSGVPPGPISNESLLAAGAREHTELRAHLFELQDYMLVPEPMWQHLLAWYGGGPAIPRPVVRRGYARTLAVDVHLRRLELLRSSAPDEAHVISISAYAKIRELRDRGCKIFGLGERDVQMWDYHKQTKAALLADMDATVREENLINNQSVLFEERGPDGKFPRVVKKQDFTEDQTAVAGQCGLSNMGNTCFMNSALQCLSGSAPLRRFFLSGKYRTDLNVDNPLGCGGELASVFGDLLQTLWSGRYRSFAPREFKHQLERFAAQFSGYQQHDAQELLAFLLDGLHEDLNRVKQKPYVEQKESDGRPDAIVAEEAWEAHRLRNDSVIVDYFQGQLKSTVECDEPSCGRIATTFDPFMYLSVPLPQVTTRTIPVTVVPRSGAQPVKYAVTLEKTDSVGDLKRELSTLCGIAPECMVIADVYMHKIHSDHESSVPLKSISSRDDIYAYEILPMDDEQEADEQAKPATQSLYTSDDADEFAQTLKDAATAADADDDDDDDDDDDNDDANGNKKASALAESATTALSESADGADPLAMSSSTGAMDPAGAPEQADADEHSADDNKDDGDDDAVAASKNLYLLVYHKHEMSSYSMFGLPLVLSFERRPTYIELVTRLYERIKRTLAPRSLFDDASSEGDANSADAADGADNEADGDKAGGDMIAAAAEALDDGTEADAAAAEDAESDPEWLAQIEDEGMRAVVRHIKLTVPDGSFHDRVLEFGDGKPLKLNSRDQVTLHYMGELSQRYDVTRDKLYAKHQSMKDASAQGSAPQVSLEECMSLFTKRERLGEDNMWYCSRCKEHRRAYKKFDIWRWPRILVVHLKRFSYSSVMSRFLSRGKLDTLVSFPTDNLQVEPFSANKDEAQRAYQLFGVTNHFGGMGGGHYIAHVTHTQSEAVEEAKWHRFDDTVVSEASADDLVSSSAYLLFYRRKDTIDADKEAEIEAQEHADENAVALEAEAAEAAEEAALASADSADNDAGAAADAADAADGDDVALDNSD